MDYYWAGGTDRTPNGAQHVFLSWTVKNEMINAIKANVFDVYHLVTDI